ncbi:hypothetical protein [Azohydromonas lata]|uniref:Uncharacterized protein n=1 Tax=Azohydromonas lata TaxID=45677 RepID=A0ABU5IC76_9BURK|nr:hypothetical protein [Azohydromonas lata]MDZ5456717.1 hypothetical protein [Azohydromonas lata]
MKALFFWVSVFDTDKLSYAVMSRNGALKESRAMAGVVWLPH